MTNKERKCRPHIKLVQGEWYAFGGRGYKQSVNLLLVPAISFCNKLNHKLKVRGYHGLK